MATFKLEIATDAPNIRHTIHFGGEDFELEMDGGVWRLWRDGTLIVVVGRRNRWQDALRDALVFIAAAPAAPTAGGGDE